jgi:hypothetical protein
VRPPSSKILLLLSGHTDKRKTPSPKKQRGRRGNIAPRRASFLCGRKAGTESDPRATVGGALGYTNGADEQWASDPVLVAARPAYEEMKNKVISADCPFGNVVIVFDDEGLLKSIEEV